MLELDHLAVLGETLHEAAEYIEDLTGLPMDPGGFHPHFATHNRLMGLRPNLYLEAIASDPGQPRPAWPRWFGLDAFRGPPQLDKWILRTSDMAKTLEALPMAGEPISLRRGDLRWTMAVPLNGLLPFDGMFPAIIQWHSAVPPGKALPKPDLELRKLTVCHPEVMKLQAVLSPHLASMPVAFEAGPAGLRAELSSAGAPLCLT